MAGTPNMGLILPVPTVTPGPTYAAENNAAFNVIDAHNHTPGLGAPIPTAGIVLNADLPFNSFNALALRSVQVNNQSSPLGLPSDVTCLYGSGGNLYWNNAIGQQVQITSGAGLNAASIGAIGGDYGTSSASLFYTSASSLFTFWQSANRSALIDCGSVTIRPTNTTGTNGVTLNAPVGLALSYGLTFMSALPPSPKIVTIDNSGTIASSYDVDGSTIVVTSNTIQVPAGGITATQIANGTITTTQISSTAAILGSQLTSAPNFTGVPTTTITSGNFALAGLGGESNLFILRSSIASNGANLHGSGIALLSHTPGTGVYSLGFNNPFSSVPTVIVCNASPGLLYGVGTSSATTNGCSVTIIPYAGGSLDAAFNIIVMGPIS